MTQAFLKKGLIAGSLILVVVIALQLREHREGVDLGQDIRGQIDLVEKIEQALKRNSDDNLMDSLLLKAEVLLFPELEKENERQIHLLYLKAMRFSQLQNIKKAQAYLEQAESLIRRIDSQLEYDVIRELYSIYNRENNTDRESEVLMKYIIADCEPTLLHNKVELLLNKSHLAYKENRQNQAMLFAEEAKELAGELTDTNMMVRCQSWVYHIDTTISIKDKLLGLLELERYKEKIEDNNLWRLYANIADIYYFDLGDNEKTYEYMLKQVNIVGILEEGFRKKRIQSIVLLNMADAARNMAEYDEARYWIDSAETFLAYMNAEWIPEFHDTYVGAYNMDEGDAKAKLASINQYLEYAHIAKSDSQVRLVEGHSEIALRMFQRQSRVKSFWATVQISVLTVITLLFVFLTYKGYKISSRSRRRIDQDNGIRALQNLLFFGTRQAKSPIFCHLKNVMLEAKISGYDDLAEKVTTVTNSLSYTAGNWEEPLGVLDREIVATKLLIKMLVDDESYGHRKIELVVEDTIQSKDLKVPRYFVKSCLFMVLNAMEKGDAGLARVVIAHVHDDLRLTATLDNRKEIMIDFDQATEVINTVLGQYDKDEVTFEPAGDKYVLNVSIPYQDTRDHGI